MPPISSMLIFWDCWSMKPRLRFEMRRDWPGFSSTLNSPAFWVSSFPESARKVHRYCTSRQVVYLLLFLRVRLMIATVPKPLFSQLNLSTWTSFSSHSRGEGVGGGGPGVGGWVGTVGRLLAAGEERLWRGAGQKMALT